MKNHIFFLFITLIIINILSNYKVISEEIEKEKKTKNIEENDEFDDPSLLKKKLKKKEEKSNSAQEEKNSKINADNDTDNIYPSIDQLRQEKIEEINKYKYFFLLHMYEICMFCLVIIFLLNTIYGIKKNRNIAEKWFLKNKEFYEENYAHLGGEREYNPQNLTLIKDSYSDYKFYASGRVYINWMVVDIFLKRRQDLITVLCQLFLLNERDKIIYRSSLSPSEEVPFVFTICKKNNVKNMKKHHRELVDFAEIYNPSFMDKSLTMLTEDEETTNKIFSNRQLMSQYNKIEKFLELIFFTDRRTEKDSKFGLYVSFELRTSYTEADFFDMTLFTHMLIDILGSTSVRASYRKEANARRKEFEAKISRELAEKNKEEVKNAKEEKKNAELNKPMTREQLRKKEEKERKDAIKERRKKLFKMVKV